MNDRRDQIIEIGRQMGLSDDEIMRIDNQTFSQFREFAKWTDWYGIEGAIQLRLKGQFTIEDTIIYADPIKMLPSAKWFVANARGKHA